MKCLTTLLREVSIVVIGMTCCIIHQNQNIQCGLHCDGRFLEEMPLKKFMCTEDRALYEGGHVLKSLARDRLS